MDRIVLGSLGLCFALAAPLGCDVYDPGPPPLGMTLAKDDITYAGAAVIDITPEITETYTDLNDNHEFDGCVDEPAGGTEDCPEPFDDVNGNGWFDAVWMAGFGPKRPAFDVSDPITVRALVLSYNHQYIAFVALDLVGLGSPRIHAARDRLAADGFDPDRLIVASTHNHQGPDTMGLWGDPYDIGDPITGLHEDYQELVSLAIEDAVRQAAAHMEPVTLKVGAMRMRDRSVWLNGPVFSGKNPDARMHGMIHDGRDPVVVSDQLLVLQGERAPGDAVFTLTNWSGHPETWGGNNTSLSADWVGVAREVLEDAYGGVAIHLPECLGGMQSALNGDLPRVEADGTHVFQTCDASAVTDASDADCFGLTAGDPRVDGDGDPVPEWAPRNSRAFVVSHGWLIAEAAMDVLADAETTTADPIRVDVETFYVPVTNLAYKLMGPTGIFDLGLEDAITDDEICPDIGSDADGCLENRAFRIRVGPVGLVTAPAEILPELTWGFPEEDPAWQAEVDDPTARGAGATYFPQHDAECNTIEYAECADRFTRGDCDCLRIHNWPYVLSDNPDVPPILDLVDTPYRAALSMVDSYLSYMIPEPDFNVQVSLLSDDDGDHYEDTVSVSYRFATRWQEAQLRLWARSGW